MYNRFHSAALPLLVLGVTLSFAFTPQPASPQALSQAEYPITVNMRKYPAWMVMPLQVTEVRVKEKRVELDVPFLHTEDWLRDFSVLVKNTSDRAILGLRLNLEWATDPNDELPYIPETVLYAGQQFQMGRDGPGRKLVLKPGETIELFVEKAWWDSHNNHIAGTAHAIHKQMPDMIRRRATLKYDYVGFDADNVWLKGFDSRRDPDNPNSFIVDEIQRNKISRILKTTGRTGKLMKAQLSARSEFAFMSET